MKQQEDDEAKEEKRTSMFFSLLHSAAKTHKNGSKAIWPKCMGEIMLKKYVTIFQDCELLEILLKGEVTIKEITKKYDSEGKKSALKTMLRFNEECLSKHNALMPVTVDRSKQTLTLVEEYREWIQELSEKSGGLASLMGSKPTDRIFTASCKHMFIYEEQKCG
jgi:hypothetical protein